MTKQQFLLLKLSEECAEVAQRCSKQIQFGPLEIQTGHSLTNAERLKQELLDLFSIWKILEENKQIPEFSEPEVDFAYENKKLKLQKYLDYSFKLGELPEIKL
jgi:NTP pyrophosphatase (non-canonical NTP hydrolase)